MAELRGSDADADPGLEDGDPRPAREALEAANAILREQASALEMSNEQLQQQAIEFEAQAEELQVTAAALGERTEEAERARSEAEAERARALDILESMADAHFILDRDYRFVSANAAMERNVAHTREQLIGRSIWAMFPATQGTVFEQSYRQAMEERVEAHFVGEYDENGLTLVPEVDAYPTADGGVAVFWRDILPRRRMEAALAASEQRFRLLADTIPTLAWTARPDGYIEWYNARWYAYTGTTPEQMEGWGWQAVHDRDMLPEIMARWEASIGSGEPFEMTFPLRCADGQFRRFLTRVIPVRDADGRIVQWVGSNTDVEAESTARAAVETAEERLRNVFGQAPIAVAVMEGPDHVYTIVSPLYAASPGFGRPLIGRRMRDVFPEVETQGYIETVDRVYETGVPFGATEREVLLVPPEGGASRPFYYNIGYQPIRNAQGRVYAVASVAHDVTENVLARREAEAARAEAEEANRAKSEFLSTMSHELRTPLNAIGGYAELMALGIRGPVTPEQGADLERIRRANDHLVGLISDILNFARIEGGRLDLHLADVQLANTVADLESLIAPQMAEKGISFTQDGCAPDSCRKSHTIRADPERVRQVLLNLLTNAVKFTDSGGRIALACESDADAGAVHIRVSDTGRGIAAEALPRIFEPFVQIDRHLTRDSQQGVGLGLAISRELARGMGGDLSVESTPGKGSRFTLTLPLGSSGVTGEAVDGLVPSDGTAPGEISSESRSESRSEERAAS